MKKNFKIIGFSIFLLAVGLFLGRRLPRLISEPPTKSIEFSFINRSVTANLGKHFIINFKPLRTELTTIQKKYPQKTYVYFSYLNNGSWIGLNEREEFTAASTIKVPVAMSLLKAVEDGKLSLADSYSLEELDLDPSFGDLYKVGADREFTVQELMRIMLVQSDDTALNAILNIFRRIGIEDPLIDVYGSLGWDFVQDIPEFGQPVDYLKISPKTLSTLFVALYDAKYVNLEHSQMILRYLAETPFDTKLDSGVPSDVTVSHKIGVATQDKTFSDCGIIYAPNRNYLLCLGSVGADDKTATSFMVEISKAVYSYVIDH